MQILVILLTIFIGGGLVIQSRINSINETSSKINATTQASPTPILNPTIQPSPSPWPVYHAPSFKPFPSIKSFPSLKPLPTYSPPSSPQPQPSSTLSEEAKEIKKSLLQVEIDSCKDNAIVNKNNSLKNCFMIPEGSAQNNCVNSANNTYENAMKICLYNYELGLLELELE